MYSDFYTPSITKTATTSFSEVWLIISAVVAVVGGILLYIFFIRDKNVKQYTNPLQKLHGYLNFKKFYIEDILKIMYTISALFITLISFRSNNVLSFFIILLVGNFIARISYELVLMFVTLVNNTIEINNKLDKGKK